MLLRDLPEDSRLPAARMAAYEAMPYFASGVQSLVPVDVPGLETVGVTERSVLLVGPGVLEQWTAKEAGVVLLHEYLHVFLYHCTRAKALAACGRIPTAAHFRVWGIAADIQVNGYLSEAGLVVPNLTTSHGVSAPQTWRRYGFKPDLSVEEYYDLLLQKLEPSDDGSEEDDDENENPIEWGRCGSGSGNPLPNEPKPSATPGALPGTYDQDGRTEGEQQMQRMQDAGEINKFSNVPLGLKRAADILVQPSKVSWQTLLATLLRTACACAEGSGRETYSRRNRNQSGYDMFGDETALFPGTKKHRAKVALVADTSGSMGKAEFQKIINEANAILRAVRGGKVTFIAADAEVHVNTKVASVRDLAGKFVGGGGTDFRPAFRTLTSMPPSTRPDVVVYATDGYGEYPSAPPAGMKVIWLEINGKIDVDWGTRVVAE